jgi:hypothetical protein
MIGPEAFLKVVKKKVLQALNRLERLLLGLFAYRYSRA